MPKVFGNVMNVAGIPLDGTVWVSSPEWRPGGTSLITMNRKTYQVVNGEFETDGLVPGHVLFEFRGDGDGQVRRKEYAVVVQAGDEPVDFLDLVESGYEYPQEVVGQAQAAARESRQWAEASEASKDAAEALYGDLSAVNAARAASEAARDLSRSARDVSIAKRDEAEGFAEDAEESAQSASGSADSAVSSVAAAGASETNAATSASNATSAKTAAEAARDAAIGARNTAVSAAEEAEGSADAASTAEIAASDHLILAAQSASSAAVSAGNAADSAEDAANDVRSELLEISDATADSAAAALVSEGNAADRAHAAELSAIEAASVVSDGVADASGSIKGKLRLAGDLGGTADSPTVPGLAGKANATHTHVMSDVTGLGQLNADVGAATSDASGGTLMKRTGSGRTSVAAPTESGHAANRQYVDDADALKVNVTSATNRVYVTGADGSQTQYQHSQVATADSIARRTSTGALVTAAPTATTHATTKAYVDSRPALWLWSGTGTWTPPSGAASGDSVLNLQTGEVYSITEEA